MNRVFRFVFQNKWLWVIVVYTGLMLTVIKWGIPNKNHPFCYQMDEWHQLNSIRAVFKYGTPNVEGAAHGPMFFFLLSGIYLIPFVLLKIIDPFSIKSGLTNLSEIGRIFIILRLNTLFFGTMSAFILGKLAKDFLKINPLFTVAFFIFTPAWLVLSNYFKYDIALIFWIVLFFLLLLKYKKLPSLKNYFILGVVCGLAIATKISALPLILIYYFSYILFTPPKNPQKHFSLFLGSGAVMVTFALLGVPYLLLGHSNFGDFFSSNLLTIPAQTANFFTGARYLPFLIFQQIPTIFGHFFAILFIISFLYLLLEKRSYSKEKTLVIFSFLIFAVSLAPLKIFVSNRSLVLLPFMVLIIGLFLREILPKKVNFLIKVLLMIIFLVQMTESLAWMAIKIGQDPRERASFWLTENISKNTVIGIENIPIYQMLPDIVLKEYYSGKQELSGQIQFKYRTVDFLTKDLPLVVIITNQDYAWLQKDSAKKKLIFRLIKEGYFPAVSFAPNWKIYKFFSDQLNFFISGLIPSPTITVYRNPHRNPHRMCGR